MFPKLIAIVLVLGLGGVAAGGDQVWHECQIEAGRIGTCGKPASGKGVAFHEGAYRECRFVGGRVSTCTRRFSGKLALADEGGIYRECDIRSGRESTCARRFSGTQFLIAN